MNHEQMTPLDQWAGRITADVRVQARARLATVGGAAPLPDERMEAAPVQSVDWCEMPAAEPAGGNWLGLVLAVCLVAGAGLVAAYCI